jgi:tRNA1(Val) A37 N6-methylase TrmN6
MKNEEETLDTFYHGRILVLQKKKGYRFSVDAPILADFIQPRSSDELLEIGTGCGIIPLLLSIKPFKHITALEIQSSLADLARRNVHLNNLESKITVIHTDFRTYKSQSTYDIVFSNPPYIKGDTGHLSRSLERSIAKHELKGDILSIMERTAVLLKKRGKAFFIFPQKRRHDFLEALEINDLKVHSTRFIQPRSQSRANLFLTQCGFAEKQEILLPPLILFDDDGNYTKEAHEIFAGRPL